ncbi:MAG: hypothetical protein KatS3mg102_2513 [Planctomycetota bacterium]|nr:MAG: hypothetical protein KatS3mg102_2513 [Planctomycetota bacterium]
MVEAELEAAGKSGSVLGKALQQSGYVDEEVLFAALVQQIRIPRLNIRSMRLPAESMQHLPLELARRARCIPLDRIGDILVVVTPEVRNAANLRLLRRELGGLRLALVGCAEEGFEQVLEDCYRRYEALRPRVVAFEPARCTPLAGRRLPAVPASAAEARASRPLAETWWQASWRWRYASAGPVPAVPAPAGQHPA